MSQQDAVVFIGGSAFAVAMFKFAKTLGLAVIITDKNSACNAFQYADEKIIVSADNHEGIILKVKSLQHRYNILLAYCGNDFGIQASAKINEYIFNKKLLSNDPELFNDKIWTKKIFDQAYVQSPKQWVLKSNQLSYNKCPLPRFIIKPYNLSGAVGVKEISDSVGFDNYLKTYSQLTEQLIIEEIAEGTQHDVNGFFVEGKFYPAGIGDRYFSAFPDCYPIHGNFPSLLSDAKVTDCYKAVEKIGIAAGIITSPIKADVFVTKTGASIIEIGLRFHGDITSSYMLPTTGDYFPFFDYFVSIYKQYREAYVNAFDRQSKMIVRWQIIPFKKGIIRSMSVENAESVEGVKKIFIRKVIGDVLPEKINDNQDMLGYIITQGKTLKECKQCANIAITKLNIQVT